MLESDHRRGQGRPARGSSSPATSTTSPPTPARRSARTRRKRPVTRKGTIRVEMERRLRGAADEGVKVLILRAGDFFGPAAPNSALGWLTDARAGRHDRRLSRRARPTSATPSPICRTWPRPWRGCSTREDRPGRLRGVPLRAAIGWSAATSSAKRSAGSRGQPRPADPRLPLVAGLRPPRRSSRRSASCWRCATSGGSRSASTTPSWSPSSATEPHTPLDAGARRDPGRHGLPWRPARRRGASRPGRGLHA